MRDKYRLRSVFASTTCTMLALSLCSMAKAQSSTPDQQDVYQATPVDAAQPARSGDHFVFGLGGGYAPAYQGADHYRALPVPAIDIAWGPMFANLRNGIGINAINTHWLTLGVSATYMPGYRAKDVPIGVGRLPIGAGARAFASVKAAGFVGTVGVTKGIVGSNKGIEADVSLSYPLALSPRLTLAPMLGTSWANHAYNQRYFGIDGEQAAASRLTLFSPGSGLKDASAFVTANYRLTNRWILGLSGGVTTLLDDVKDSPLVHHKTQPSGFLSIAYRFGK